MAGGGGTSENDDDMDAGDANAILRTERIVADQGPLVGTTVATTPLLLEVLREMRYRSNPQGLPRQSRRLGGGGEGDRQV